MESSQYAGEAVRVMAAATELVGGAAEAEAWFRNQRIADFDGKTAEELVFRRARRERAAVSRNAIRRSIWIGVA